jgi:L-fuconolactonase
MIVDSHVHLWDLGRGGYEWLTPELAPINRSIGPADLAACLAATDVDAAILVQSDESDADNEYLLEVAANHEQVLGVVGWLDLAEPATAAARLDTLIANPWFCGVRVGINHEPDADWILREEVAESLEAVGQRDVPFDLVSVRRRHLELVPELSERHPKLRIVIDHLAKPPIGKDESWVNGWKQSLSRAAENPNVYAKISGMTPARGPMDAWTPDDLRPFVEYALEVFGPRRLMFGTDWPVSELAGGYNRVWTGLNEILCQIPPADYEDVMGGTALRFYGRNDKQVAQQ